MLNFTTISKAKKQAKLAYLGTTNISAKIIKNFKVNNVLTYCMYFAPAEESGYNVCSHSTPECRIGCLATSGRAKMDILAGVNAIRNARIRKTKLFYQEPDFFFDWLIADLKSHQNKANKKGIGFGVRLNGTSDLDWALIKHKGKTIFEYFPEISFYDYTKNFHKFQNKPSNYHLTYSYTGRNWSLCEKVLKQGDNVAMVFNVNKKDKLPATFKGYEVIDGDLTDLRTSDPKGVIVGLRFKHIADKEAENEVLKSCFVVQP